MPGCPDRLDYYAAHPVAEVTTPPPAAGFRVTNVEATFDLAEGERRRDAGLKDAENVAGRLTVIKACRAAMVSLALTRTKRTVTSDDAQAWLISTNTLTHLGNAMGSMFRCPGWQYAGTAKTKRPEGHARRVSVWRFVGDVQ
jgi:hypothetical protein